MRWLSEPPDQRRLPRFEADVPAIASLVDDNEITSVRVRCNGISEGGVSVLGVEGLALGDLVSLELHIPVATQPIWVDAVVRHNTECYGLEFLPLSDEQRNAIRRYCRVQRRQKRRK